MQSISIEWMKRRKCTSLRLRNRKLVYAIMQMQDNIFIEQKAREKDSVIKYVHYYVTCKAEAIQESIKHTGILVV